MFRTTEMKLVELMVLRRDIDRVLEYLGRHANFQIQNTQTASAAAPASADSADGAERDMLARLESCRNYLGIADAVSLSEATSLPSEDDTVSAERLLAAVADMQRRELETADRHKRVTAAHDEARAFANLKVAYSELEHLTFLSLRIGRINPAVFAELRDSVGERAVIVALGEDNSRIFAAASKKGRFALDTELKRFGFVPLEIPKGFKGVPDEVLAGLADRAAAADSGLAETALERTRFAETHAALLLSLLQTFSLGSQVKDVRRDLEATQLVYRLSGWIASGDSAGVMQDLDELTQGRVAVRIYAPPEVPSVRNGREKVPVQYRHGPFVKSFERMIFSYGSPLYGTVDPTPVVAFFFTLLFGIMFGDVGQGLVFFALGILLVSGRIAAFKKWGQFGAIFIAIGCSSMVMGLITGEFFSNPEVLRPFARYVTGLFGESRDVILELMPSRDAMDRLVIFFGFTLAVGFIINSIGLVINIVNQFSLGHTARALFGKTGVCGAVFFWYVVFAAIRIASTGGTIAWYDIACVSVSLLGVFFSEPLERLTEGHRPVFENGLLSAAIQGIVEILEIVSTAISNSVSFLRVGAFALAHAVLGFIIFTLSDMVGGSLSPGGLVIGIFGNAVIIALEGLIVTIQVIRLQYYEFFSKFFTETGREFKPFRFTYKEN